MIVNPTQVKTSPTLKNFKKGTASIPMNVLRLIQDDIHNVHLSIINPKSKRVFCILIQEELDQILCDVHQLSNGASFAVFSFADAKGLICPIAS